MRAYISLLTLVFVICIHEQVAGAEDEPRPQTIYLPESMRAEGRITLTYNNGSDTITHHLAFTELIDHEHKRSKVSIGYISYQQAEYQTRSGQTITLDERGNCKATTSKSFVPELDWFVRMMYTEEEIAPFLSLMPHQVGPSGLIWKMMLINRDKKDEIKTNYENRVSHRNIDCHLSWFKYERTRCKSVQLDLYVPVKNFFADKRVPMFSVKETAPSESAGSYGTSFLIDYFNIESTESMDPHQLEQMEMEFNLPLARGCSEFLPQTRPYGWNIGHSFMIQYYQRLAMAHVIVAYDNQFNYLRKEFFERSVSIWDLNEELLYHSDSMGLRRLSEEQETSADVTPCSVLNVEDNRLGPSVKPYNHTGSSIVMIDLLGAYDLAFVGRGRVRSLPCAIYETILGEPPNIFALNTETAARTGHRHDYIVQFHLLRADANSADYSSVSKLDENFWPARIVLYKRDKADAGQVDLLDQLEVYDFHRGLIGWDKKASELFMAPDCFEDEDEQLTLELEIQFDKYHLEAERRLIAHNKFKLENDLLNEITTLLHISRLHVTEFELSLRPYNVLMSLVISDRKEEKKIVYFGPGQLASPDSYLSQQVVLKGLGEQTCVSLASLVGDISLVVHCAHQRDPAQSTCTAVYGVSAAPAIKVSKTDGVPVDRQNAQCQVYRFSVDRPPKPATSDWQEWRQLLSGHQFKFGASRPDHQQEVLFNGVIQDFDLERQLQLMSISHYKYSLDYVAKATATAAADDDNNNNNNNKKSKQTTSTNQTGGPVRAFDSISYHSVGDCAKVCDLDVDCRSYSYCVESGQCLLASLDIRASNVDEQLVRSAPSGSGNKLLVDGVEAPGMKKQQYELELASDCNIHERDYLGMYAETDEVISLAARLTGQFRAEDSAFRCAQWSVELERSQPDQHHVAMFAYCPSTKSCLLDENLFAELNTTTTTTSMSPADQQAAGVDERVHCQVYRRKYQTYFHVSTEVVQRNKMYQLELSLNTVEECARSCWNRFGQICASFDFCSPNDCIINIIPNEADPKLVDDMSNRRELRPDCLHYARDLRLDQLRQEHLIGRHQALVVAPGARHDHQTGGSMGWPLVFNVVLFSLLSASFLVGLAVGHRVNERLEKVTILALRQSFSAGPANLARRASQALGGSFNFSRFNGAHSPYLAATTTYDSHTNEPDDYIVDNPATASGFHEKVLIEGSSGIQMEEIKRPNVIIEEEGEDDDEQQVDDDDDDDDDDDGQQDVDGRRETSQEETQAATRSSINSSPDHSNDNEVPNLVQL